MNFAALLGLDEDLDWHADALCAQTDPEAFYPEKGGSTREAKTICKACPVVAECLTYALDNGERFGIWGGLSERERHRLKGRPAGQRAGTGQGGEHDCPQCVYSGNTEHALKQHRYRHHRWPAA